MHIYAYISFICMHGNYMQFLHMQIYIYINMQIYEEKLQKYEKYTDFRAYNVNFTNM